MTEKAQSMYKSAVGVLSRTGFYKMSTCSLWKQGIYGDAQEAIAVPHVAAQLERDRHKVSVEGNHGVTDYIVEVRP